MKKACFTPIIFLFFITSIFAKTNPTSSERNRAEIKQNAGIVFTENKGQVHDQNYKTRPDVLFGVMAGNMAVHIKNNGISYQVQRIDSYKEVEDIKTNRMRQEPDKQTIYRIDLNWINYNKHFVKETDETIEGYDNYYLANCPNGTMRVRSYKGVTLRDLFKGIDLHYYEKNNELKHDYIVAAHADYKQIQVKVEGATIRVNDDGSLFLITPFGNVQEAAPLVFQNGKKLRSKWQIDDNILSFHIDNYDSNYELVIDPLTRLWGTYYGAGVSAGGGNEYGYACATDLSNNAYLAGSCTSSTGTIIATSGSHQSTFIGFENAFLAKFNSNGTRLWGTYYGGDGGGARAFSCTTDNIGNVFIAGLTTSTAGVATAAGHQTVVNASAFGDAFLVKFDANGVRQWGTYYGGISNDAATSCAADASGNIYIAGRTIQSSTLIATPGAHQTTFGGGIYYDAFLAKFNSSGTRLWATYYGGTGEEFGQGCAVDNNNNVYLTGQTSSSNTNVMATAGSHQAAISTTIQSDAFLVKFDANGVRLWGTYYGGGAGDIGMACSVDANNNVYLAGTTGSTNNISTPGSFQANHSMLGFDAFLAKFNANGQRIWSTYYGSPGSDDGRSCSTDAAGNVFLAGTSTGSVSTVLATTASHQTIMASSTDDAFLAKFDATGVRIGGTYYGGTLPDVGYCCATDGAGNAYLAGITLGGGNVLGSAGSHQSTFGAAEDAFLAKFEQCTSPPAQPTSILGKTVVCAGESTTYSTGLAIGASSYTWALPPGWAGAANNLTISAIAASSGIFSLTVGNGCGNSPQQTLSVIVNPVPTVVVSSGAVCLGQSFTLVPSGANSYTYSNGSVVTPTSTTAYYVTGTNTLGCSHTTGVTVLVNPLPVISVSSGAICLGQSYTMIPSGASTYTFSSGSPVVSPVVTSSYSVIGKSAAGCISSNTAVSNVTVNPLPTLSITTNGSLTCAGEIVTLSASGALSYTFTPGGVGTVITDTPNITTTYTVTGKDNKGCENTSTITQIVEECVGISVVASGASATVKLFPNPTSGVLNLELDSDNKVVIVNAIGEIVYSIELISGKHQINIEYLAKGIYMVKIGSVGDAKSIKLIKE